MTSNLSKGRTLAIDYGKARLGLAISDEKKIIATPLPTIQAEKKIENTLTKILREIQALEDKGYVINEIIVGMPLKMNGNTSPMAGEVNEFVKLLASSFSFPVFTWDERLSSVEADRSMREGKLNRKKRSKSVDAVAAVIILQSYLNKQQNTFFPITNDLDKSI